MKVRAQLESLWTNIVMVFPGATTVGGVRTGSGNASTLTVADGRAVEKECPSVSAVTWVKRDVAQVAIRAGMVQLERLYCVGVAVQPIGDLETRLCRAIARTTRATVDVYDFWSLG